ncbi:FAD/FMN-containing dehydrogenase [Klebsiella pneumoniae]|uniref:FAD/FMN-containing dehydrogenase n=1 Tax=Klebsiella pneumoniae TaxID=573 RepID=A0A377TXB4_KLEPN|nr:FAD/FMN-containing dehydrogenase [Klebsiella pneumoniae]
MTDEQRQHAVAAIQQALPALEWTLQPAKIKRLSRDFHWFSPLLTEQLAGKQADAVVRPRDEEELRQLVCACAQHQLPLTLRGSATGNYGQLVPLEGGLLVDMTGLNQIVALGNGTVRAQAGIRLADIETAARPTGWGAALYAIDLSTGEPGRSLRRRVRRYRLHQLWAAGGARQCCSASK